MICNQCKNEIPDEREKVLLNDDGDFACNHKCADQYIKDREEFFDNIANDEWYNNWMDI